MVVESVEQLRFSSVESKGLGFQVWRGRLDTVDPVQLRALLTENDVDLAIISIPVEKKDALLTIQQMEFPSILADILVYFQLELDDYSQAASVSPEMEFVQLVDGHESILDQLIVDIFQGYQNHYTANPLLSPDLIAAYQEWMRSYVSADQNQGRMGWLVKDSGKYIAFVTCDFSGTESEISLTGVVPEYRGRGVFSSVLRYLLHYFKGMGVRQIRVSTQLHNYAAQRAYTKEGFVIEQAFLIIHINSMLAAGKG